MNLQLKLIRWQVVHLPLHIIGVDIPLKPSQQVSETLHGQPSSISRRTIMSRETPSNEHAAAQAQTHRPPSELQPQRQLAHKTKKERGRHSHNPPCGTAQREKNQRSSADSRNKHHQPPDHHKRPEQAPRKEWATRHHAKCTPHASCFLRLSCIAHIGKQSAAPMERIHNIVCIKTQALSLCTDCRLLCMREEYLTK